MKINTKALLYIILTSLLFMCSCTSNTKRIDNISNPSSITIDLDRDDKVSVLDFFSNIELIPLETNKESLLTFPLQEPDRLVMHDGNFYFFDLMTESIMIFNRKGDFVNKLHFKGDGPEEYVSANDMVINRKNGNIEVLSSQGRSIYAYQQSDLKFIERIILPEDLPIIHNFVSVDNDIYVLASRASTFKMFSFNKTTNEVKEYVYSQPEWFVQSPFNGGRRSPFYSYNDSLYFVEIYNGDVYKLNKNNQKLEPRYIWDFGEHKFKISDLPENETMQAYLGMKKKLSQKFAMGFQVYAENSKYYFTRFNYRNAYKHMIYKKETGEYLLFDKFSDFGHCAPMWVDEEAMYTFVSPSILNKFVDPSTLNSENRAKYNKVRDDDNPVGVKYVFK